MTGGDGTRPETLVVLRTTDARKLATKKWTWPPDGDKWVCTSYSAGTWFYPAEQPISSLRDLVTVLETVSRDPQALVVRGTLTPKAREDVRTTGRPIRRLKHRRNGIGPTLVEVPCRWVMIDIDGFLLRASDDLADDPESAIEYAISKLLPEAFHDAECWWQLSSSAGFMPGVLKVHLFFWLTEPATNDHIKAVLRQHAPGIDLAPFSCAQPHYIAAPLIEGAPDPLPRRTGWRKGSDAAVTLPPLRPEAARQRKHGVGNGTGSGFPGHTVEAALALR